MNATSVDNMLDALAARLAALERDQSALRQENHHLTDELTRLQNARGVSQHKEPVPLAAPETGHRTSRRTLLKTLAGATVGAGAVALAAGTGTAAAANGDAVIAGQLTTETSQTEVSNTSGGGNGLVGSSGGSGNGVVGQVAVGQTDAASFYGVLGSAINGIGVTGASSSGTGGNFSSNTGIALTAVSNSSIAGSFSTNGATSTGVVSTTTGTSSIAVKGICNATGTLGIGVWGAQPSGGWGVYGTSTSGIGGNFNGGTGWGVIGNGRIGVQAIGTSVGVIANGAYGGYFAGSVAALHVVPTTTSGPPNSGAHLQGDLVVDSAGILYICTASGTPGTWSKVGAQ